MPVTAWTKPTGDFATASNWSSNTVPTAGYLDVDEVGIITATNYTIANQSLLIDYDQHTQPGLNLVNSALSSSTYLLAAGFYGPVEMTLAGNNELDGTIVSAYGSLIQTVASGYTVNNGTIQAIGQGTTYQGSDTIIDNGFFQNAGMIQAQDHGTISVVLGASGNAQVLTNNGIIESDKGGRLNINAPETGTLQNAGQVNVNGGTMALGASLFQTAHGAVTISNNGSLTLAAGTDGGSIKIQSGMLNFAATPTYASPGPTSASAFHSALDFTGSSGGLTFGTTTIAEAFKAATAELIITAPWEGGMVQIADIHLGSAQAYSASDFSVHGSTLVFHSTAHVA